jgi:two-component system, chemotaxis family, response regulator WspF
MRIAIVNDLSLAVEVLRRLIRSVPGYEVAWTAADGMEAVEKCALNRPDLILMDLIMPVMDGVKATKIIMEQAPCAILIVTATVSGNADKVFEAMSFGALDAVATPVFGLRGSIEGGGELLRKIEVLGRLVSHEQNSGSTPQPGDRSISGRVPRMIAIGASAGGPNALATILRGLSMELKATIVIVQHLDMQFAPGLADWLNEQTGLHVTLAREGMKPEPGGVFIAGTNDHLIIGADLAFHYTVDPVDYAFRPSVNEFFYSLSRNWPDAGMACLLTGMGRDGAEGLLALRKGGWRTLAQDEKTSVVYGMPRAAVEIGAAEKSLPLELIPDAILREMGMEV